MEPLSDDIDWRAAAAACLSELRVWNPAQVRAIFSKERIWALGGVMRLLISAVLLVLSITQAEAQHRQIGLVDGWLIQQNSKTGDCSGDSEPNRHGTRLVVVRRSEGWSAILYNAEWTTPKGSRLAIEAYVDRDRLPIASAEVLSLGVVLLHRAAHPASDHVFKELMAGRMLRVKWQEGTTTVLSLSGVSAALVGVLDCAEGPSQEVATAPQQRQQQVAAYRVAVVSREETMVMATRLFSRAGVSGFEMLPGSNAEEQGVWFRMADGHLFGLTAYRGETVSGDEYASHVVANLSKSCTGTLGTITERLPSTDGTVIRRLRVRCEGGAEPYIATVRVIRKPDGLLAELTTLNTLASLQEGRVEDLHEAGIVDAVLGMGSAWGGHDKNHEGR